MSAKRRKPTAEQLPDCVDGCAAEPWESWSSQPSSGWHRFVLRGLPPSAITMRAISVVGCPCRLEQLLRLPGLSTNYEPSLAHGAAEKWQHQVEAELEQMATVEKHLRAALSAAELALGLEYGLRITHASRPKFEDGRAVTAPLESPIKITMRDLLTLLAERLKEDATRRRGSLDESGLHMTRPGKNGQHLKFTAYSPQDRHIGKDDALSRALLADAVTASTRARPAGEFRSAFAVLNRQQAAALRNALPEWDRGELADLIAVSYRDWNHPPTNLDRKYVYDPAALASDDVSAASDAKQQRKALMEWLREQEKTRASPRDSRANPRRKRGKPASRRA